MKPAFMESRLHVKNCECFLLADSLIDLHNIAWTISMESSVLDKLATITKVSSELMQSKSLEEAIDKALDMVRVQLNAQVASLFLLSKEGVVERIGISGTDAEGTFIENEWLQNEHYEPGESFSGCSIPTADSDSEYGSPNFVFSDLIETCPKMKYGRDYKEKLGELRCGISIPLNGTSGTFGSLEVLNKNIPAKFTYEDVVWLSLIGSNLSGIIRLFISKEYNETFQSLVDILVSLKPNSRGFDLNAICEGITKLVISRFTPYKVCIIRVPGKDESLRIKAQSYTDDISWLKRKNSSIPKKCYIIGQVYDTQKAQYIEDIESNINSFFNKVWIRDQELKSYACLPLSIRENCVGTISVYTTFTVKFRKSERDFLEYLAFLIAAIIERVRIINELARVRKELSNSQEKFLNSSILVGYETQLQGIAHQYKNELIEISLTLKELLREEKNKKEKSRIIYEKLNWIERRRDEISALISERETAPVDINELIKKILRTILVDDRIKLREDYNWKIPIIAVESEKIASVVHNLLSNSIVSINQADRKQGEISIVTDIVKVNGIRKIRISVRDNGIGISNEVKDKIYKQGFTTRKQAGGTGLGLYISKMIVEEYGGRLYYESRIGQGTTFHIEIPLRRYQV